MTFEEKTRFGERLGKLRTSAHMTQEQAAEKLDISLRYYQMLERGENIGSVDLLLAISNLMDCSLDYLLRGRLEQTGKNSLVNKLNALSARQRANAEKLLDLWVDCLQDK